MPVIQATYSRGMSLSFVSQSALGLALLGSFVYAPTMYVAGGAFGYVLYGILCLTYSFELKL